MLGDFGQNYGCLINEVRVLRRAVFVVDQQDKIVYSDYMAELGLEPHYGEVINAAKSALS